MSPGLEGYVQLLTVRLVAVAASRREARLGYDRGPCAAVVAAGTAGVARFPAAALTFGFLEPAGFFGELGGDFERPVDQRRLVLVPYRVVCERCGRLGELDERNAARQLFG